MEQPVEGKALAMTDRGELARPSGESEIFTLLRAIVDKQLTPESAATAEKMADLLLKIKAVDARQAFAEAKAALQADLPPIVVTKSIPGRDGVVRSTYAPYEEIMEKVQPFLVKHGFSLSFTTEVDEKRMTVFCTLTHLAGHSETNKFAVRCTGGPPGCSDAQADGSNHSYARRYALCDALNISIDHDTDARLEGGLVSAQVAAELEKAVKATKSDKAAFLAFAEAATFAEIRESKVGVLRAALAKKAAKRAAGRPAEPPREPGQGALPY